MAIAEFLGRPLARLSPLQIEHINQVLEETLDKTLVMADIKSYFTSALITQWGMTHVRGNDAVLRFK